MVQHKKLTVTPYLSITNMVDKEQIDIEEIIEVLESHIGQHNKDFSIEIQLPEAKEKASSCFDRLVHAAQKLNAGISVYSTAGLCTKDIPSKITEDKHPGTHVKAEGNNTPVFSWVDGSMTARNLATESFSILKRNTVVNQTTSFTNTNRGVERNGGNQTNGYPGRIPGAKDEEVAGIKGNIEADIKTEYDVPGTIKMSTTNSIRNNYGPQIGYRLAQAVRKST